jgi:hypothetical protein
MVTAQLDTPDATGTSSHQHQASPASLSPSWPQLNHPIGHDLFRQIFRDHWDRWCDQCLEADSNTKQRVTITCSALDFISRLVPHIPPKGLQIVRCAGLYARNIKRKLADIARVALEAVRLRASLFDLEPDGSVLPTSQLA